MDGRKGRNKLGSGRNDEYVKKKSGRGEVLHVGMEDIDIVRSGLMHK